MAERDYIRLATVKATGERYIVQRLFLAPDPKDSKCYVWGNVTSFKDLVSKHTPSHQFMTSEVDIVEVEKTSALLRELMEQHVKDLEASGKIVQRTRGGNYKVVGERQSA